MEYDCRAFNDNKSQGHLFLLVLKVCSIEQKILVYVALTK